SIPDMLIWTMLWLTVAMYGSEFALPSSEARAAETLAHPALRVAHAIAAVTGILIFLGLHLANHLVGLVCAEAHEVFMKAVRQVYRAPVGEPILVVLLLFQVGSGVRLATHRLSRPMNRMRAFQVASGIYLAFYLLGHMNSVFVFARLWLGIDTDW